MFKWFKKSSPPKLPEPGEVWYIKSDDGSPWPPAGNEGVTITDVKEGWVRYDLNPPSSRLADQCLKMTSFLTCYRFGNEN